MTFAIEGIQNILREILDAQPAGMSEYDLLKGLAERNVSLFNEDYFKSPSDCFSATSCCFIACTCCATNCARLGKGT